MISGDEEETNQKEEKESCFKTTAGVPSLLSKELANLPIHSNKEESKFLTADPQVAEGRYGLIPREETIVGDGQSPLQRNVSEIGTEEGMIVHDAMADHEPETLDEREDESDYEQVVTGEDDNLDEADQNAEAKEYMDDDDNDDGDDFAKKIGVMFS